SLQSGSDTILKLMKRKYTTREYKTFIENIRTYFPKASITTDGMVGFPEEGKVEFEETCTFVRKIAFSKVHVLKYSPRIGTPAANYNNQVNGKIKDIRSKKLLSIAKNLEKQYYNQFLNS